MMESRWVKYLVNDVRKAGVLSESIRNETKESIRKKMRELDAREWMTEMNDTSSLKIYRNGGRRLEGNRKPTITTKLQ